ncbi:hypothetical protein ACYAFX_21960 [Rhodococcus aetherivorans]
MAAAQEFEEDDGEQDEEQAGGGETGEGEGDGVGDALGGGAGVGAAQRVLEGVPDGFAVEEDGAEQSGEDDERQDPGRDRGADARCGGGGGVQRGDGELRAGRLRARAHPGIVASRNSCDPSHKGNIAGRSAVGGSRQLERHRLNFDLTRDSGRVQA